MAGPNVMVGDDISVLAGNLITNDLNGNLTVAGNLSSGSFSAANLSTAGNLTFTGVGTGQQILGDFSSGLVGGHLSRTYVQSTVTNGNTQVSLVPNGSSVTSGVFLENTSGDLTNSCYGAIFHTNAKTFVGTAVRGTGTLLPLVLTGSRIQADWSNGTQNNRTCLQSSTANGGTSVEIIPNGTSVVAGINIENNSTVGNNAYGVITINDTRVFIGAATRGSGTPLPMSLGAGNGSIAAIQIASNGTDVIVAPTGGKVGFYGSTGAVQGSAAAMVDLPTLVAYLQSLGLLGA